MRHFRVRKQANSRGKRRARALLAGTALHCIGSAALAEPAFAPDATAQCVAAITADTPALSNHAVLDCVGRSAQACMMTRDGGTTLGMIDCLQGEERYWQGRLAAAYGERLRAARKEDAAMNSIRPAEASLEGSLVAMQTAWEAYRNAACLYEQAQWLGGSGAGPATMACHMHETARQALKLEGWWAQ